MQQNFLELEHAEQIVSWARAFEDVDDRAKVVGLEEIESEDWTLNISRYVLPPIGDEIPLAGSRRVRERPPRHAPPRTGCARCWSRRLGLLSKAAEHLSQQELESYLWGAANLLRGLIDAGDYKQYVFPLSSSSDCRTWDEEYAAAFDETSDATYARATADDRFAIPDGAHWSDVRSAPRDVGRALLNAFRAIEAPIRAAFGRSATRRGRTRHSSPTRR